MGAGEFIVNVPLIGPGGDLQWGTVIVPVPAGITMAQTDTLIQSAILDARFYWLGDSERLEGYRLFETGPNNIDYDIGGFVEGGTYYSYAGG
jgi:hypothetical protein